jgi:hypothetical protein
MYENFLDNIWNVISRLQNQTKFVIHLNRGGGFLSHVNGIQLTDSRGIVKKEIRNEIIELLKNDYPDCKVEYMETNSSYNGDILESVIVIDWSEKG